MKFEEAIKLLKEGKKIRRNKWHKNKTYALEIIPERNIRTNIIINQDNEIPELLIEEIEATDWEKYEKDVWNYAECFEIDNLSNTIEILKQKLLEDFKAVGYSEDITGQILYNRFGF